MRPPKVLLVEDEGLIRLMTAEVLQDEGFDVVEARDGDEAVRLLNELAELDALFTDVKMPGTHDGVDVAAHARQRYPTLPVLVVSGYAAGLQSRLASLDPPTAVFISKPYVMDEVIGALRRLIRTV